LKRNNSSEQLLIHVEIQSQHQQNLPERMFHYFSRLYEKHGCLILPIALLSYETPAAEQASGLGLSFGKEEILNFRYGLVQLSQLSWKDYCSSKNPVALALMAKMRIARQERAEVKFHCMKRLAGLRGLSEVQKRVIAYFVDSYLVLSEEEEKMYKSKVRKAAKKGCEDFLDIPPEQWHVKWEAKGRAEGRAEGRADVLLKLVRKRFGNLSKELETGICALDAENMDALVEDVLDFKTIEDLTAWLQNHGACGPESIP